MPTWNNLSVYPGSPSPSCWSTGRVWSSALPARLASCFRRSWIGRARMNWSASLLSTIFWRSSPCPTICLCWKRAWPRMWRNWNSHTGGRNVKLLWKTLWQFLEKLNIHLPNNLAILPQGNFPRVIKASMFTKICTLMFIEALITTNGEQSKCPSTNEWINKT